MPKLLIVDDEEDQEELILQRLRKKEFLRDYEFIFARNGLEAMHQIRTHPDIEIALMDINMPAMDGFSVLLKAKDINPILSTIMISAYDDDANIGLGISSGAYDFIAKPIDFELLEQALKKIIMHVSQLKKTMPVKLIK